MKQILLTFSVFSMGLIALAQPTIVSGVLNVNPGTFNDEGYIIQSGGELYFSSGTYKFEPGHGVDVLTHAYFEINGTNAILMCNTPGDYWKGITTYGDPIPYDPSNYIPENWGFRSGGHFTIDHAETGITMRHELAGYNSTTGQIDLFSSGYARSIHSNNSDVCQFIDNKLYDIRILNNVVARNYSASGNSGPNSWYNYKFSSTSNSFIMSIELGNTNLIPEIQKFTINSPQQGMYLSNSNISLTDSKFYTLEPNCSGIVHRIISNNAMSTTIKNSIFESTRHGIYSRYSKNLLLSNNVMGSAEHCIYLKGTIGAKVSTNELHHSEFGLEAYLSEESLIEGNRCRNNVNTDMKINECLDTKISSNALGLYSGFLSYVGIHVYNSKNTRIVRNQFKQSSRPIYINGSNPIVKIHCNTFQEPTSPMNAAIIIDDNPINDQGSMADGGANNYFNLLASSTVRVLNNTGAPLTFTNSSATGYGPNYPSTATFFGFNAMFNANCNVAKQAQESEVELDNQEPTPNPFTDVLNIGENIQSVHIYSLGGQLVEHLNVETTELNLGYLDSGIYFMIFQNNNGQQTRHKLIKQ